ncbi:MAG: hypothetical protein QOD55_2570 [Solirubrobacteraceae bacterium]|nr:hypothetical protein [Solirubrobacteraceae bacterium]MEA2290573.1 hypothetical protein [Solirubrobacteraceae bacterium]
MDRYGLEFVLSDEPDWQRAGEYLEAYNAIRPADDGDGLARAAVIDRYVTANPEVVALPADARIDEELLERARDIVEAALADASDEATADRLGDATVLQTAPASGAEAALHAAWHAGLLGAAGFALPD